MEALEGRRLLATITVDSLIDNAFPDGNVTLREAILAANTDTSVDGSIAGSGADTIEFSAALSGGTVILGGAELEITEALSIDATALNDQITIDANDASRIFNITATTGDFTLAGLTLTGGRTTGDNGIVSDNTFSGGAVRSLSSGNLTIDQSTVSGNSTTGNRAEGGGLYSTGVLTLTDSTVSENTTTGAYSRGGGIYSFGVTLADSVVSGNSTAGYRGVGGGIRSVGNVTLTGSTVSGNSTASVYADGGGINATGFVTLTSSTVSGNSTSGNYSRGGGISAGTVTLTGSTVSGNSTAGDYSSGGGIRATGAITMTNSTVSGNSTSGEYAGGGGIQVSGTITLASSTITDNHAYDAGVSGGGISKNSGDITISDSIIAGNTAGLTDPDIDPGSGALTVNFSLLGTAVTPDAGGSGIQFNDTPLIGPLSDNGGPTETHALLTGSLAIDGGDPAYDVVATPNDQRGAPFVRGAGLRVDIGSYERQTLDPSFFVVTTATDELDYSNADVSLREAISRATGSVGADTITFDTALAGNTITLGGTELQITEALAIDATALNDPVTIDANGESRVFNITATTGDFTLAGLILTGGLTTGDQNDDSENMFNGGAVRSLSSGNLIFDQSTVTGNSTTGRYAEGGGVFTRGGITLTGSTVSGNSTTGYGADGGGLRSFGAITLTSSTVSGNSTVGDFATGGGLRSSYFVALTDSTVTGNSTSGDDAAGGGIFANNTVSLTGSTVSGNSTASIQAYGGGIYSNGTVTVDGSTISGNSTVGSLADGGGIRTSGSVALTDSTVSDNSTLGSIAEGGGIFASGSFAATNSIVSGNSTQGVSSHGGGIYSAGNVTLLRSTVSGNSTTGNSASGGGIHSDGNFGSTYSTVSGNSTQGISAHGGGIRSAGNVTLLRSTVSGNSTSGDFALGGGIFSSGAIIGNSTVSGNSTTGSYADGAGIFSNSFILIDTSTVTDNHAHDAGALGGGIWNDNDPIIIIGSIVAGNTAVGGFPDLQPGSGDLDVEFSLIGDNTGTSLVEAQTPDADGNLIGSAAGAGVIDPLLGPLADNGGPTETHALLAGSPAIDAGNPGIAFNPAQFDQRGDPFVRVVNDRIDFGAYESVPLVVNSSDDIDDGNIYNGTTTLREAIAYANSQQRVDTITFDISGPGPHIIATTSPLPTITETVIIDGTSEPDYAGSPVVGIDGAEAGTTADGLRIETDDSTVKGLSIYNFARDGIELNGDGGHLITQNWLGLQIDALAAANEYGLRIRGSSANLIDGNVISGNNKSGVLINGSGVLQNILVNNSIGTDPTGQSGRANQGSGVLIQSPLNRVGSLGAGNTISANMGSGVSVTTDAAVTIVQDNRIGTNVDGTNDLGNGNFGVQLKTANNLITDNLVSGNQRHGILVSGASATNNQVLGNQVGVDVTGTSALPNSAYGIYVTGADQTVIGTTQSSDANLVSGNGGSGVVIVNSTNTSVAGNKIGTSTDGNSGLGNGGNGISMFAGTTTTTVEQNQIAGNGASGVSISGSTTTGNTVTDNLIGTVADQSAAIAGGPFGILLKAPANTVTGNTVAGATRGVVLSGVAATGNLVSGNFVGTDSVSTVNLGMPSGVQFSQGAADNTIGPDNVIANNETGVRMVGSAGVGNRITENRFLNNSVIGIDFAVPGPTANDAGDADEGANRRQNHPELESAIINGDNLDITFSVPTAVANATYDLTIEVYKSDTTGQGQQFLGSLTYTVADAGIGTITVPVIGVVLSAGLLSGDFISATATDAAGNTSEFSTAVTISASAAAPPAGGGGARSVMDVSADGRISALDALMVINSLGDQAEGESAIDRSGDVNGDAQVTALDALQIINWLSQQNRDESDSTALLFAAQVDQFFADGETELSLSESVLF